MSNEDDTQPISDEADTQPVSGGDTPQVNDEDDMRRVVVSLLIAMVLVIFVGLYLWYVAGSPVALIIAAVATAAMLVTIPWGLRTHTDQS